MEEKGQMITVMSVAVRRTILSPPAAPLDTGNPQQWSKIERLPETPLLSDYKTPLPSDYKEYFDVYSTGLIGDFVYPFNPFSHDRHLKLVEQGDLRLGALRVIRDRWGVRECPYPLYPEKGGLLPWGATENGDVLYWLTDGIPDGWSTVINESRGPRFEHFGETMTTFLVKLLSGEIVSQLFPEDFPDGDVSFKQPPAVG